MAEGTSKRAVWIGLVGALVGAAVVFLLFKLRGVPPPPFTSASFSDNAPEVVPVDQVESVAAYAWTDGARVPADADKGDPGKWKDFTKIDMRQDDLLPSHWYVDRFSLENVVTVAVVMKSKSTAPQGAKTFINFTPNAPLSSTQGINISVSSLERLPEKGPIRTLVYYGEDEAYADRSLIDIDNP